MIVGPLSGKQATSPTPLALCSRSVSERPNTLGIKDNCRLSRAIAKPNTDAPIVGSPSGSPLAFSESSRSACMIFNSTYENSILLLSKIFTFKIEYKISVIFM